MRASVKQSFLDLPLPEPSNLEDVLRFSPADNSDVDLVGAITAVQEARLTISAIATACQTDVLFGFRRVFCTRAELAETIIHLLPFAAAEIGLLFDRAGTNLIGFLAGRSATCPLEFEMRAALEELWQRLKTPILSIRNNIAHHAPPSAEAFLHGMRALGDVKFSELMKLLLLAEYCTASLLQDRQALELHEIHARYVKMGSEGDAIYGWKLDYPMLWTLFPSIRTQTLNLLGVPGALMRLGLRNLNDRMDRRRVGSAIDWQDPNDRNAVSIGTYALDGCAALSKFYFALLKEEVGCGRLRMLAGPLARALARRRVLLLFYASVGRLFEPGRLNILLMADRIWTTLPGSARSLFRTYLWPLWVAHEPELRRFRNTGAFHFARNADDRDEAFNRLQERLHASSIQSLLYMAFAFCEQAETERVAPRLVRPHPSFAPAFAFDPRHPLSLINRIYGSSFTESTDFQLILAHQPRNASEAFPSK